jgi:hypothetical protein
VISCSKNWSIPPYIIRRKGRGHTESWLLLVLANHVHCMLTASQSSSSWNYYWHLIEQRPQWIELNNETEYKTNWFFSIVYNTVVVCFQCIHIAIIVINISYCIYHLLMWITLCYIVECTQSFLEDLQYLHLTED